MKKVAAFWLALCLLLGGCAVSIAPPAAGTPNKPNNVARPPAPEEPATEYLPYYADPSVRGLRADVTYRGDTIPTLGRLNNLYGGWAQGLYETVTAQTLTVSRLSAPDLQWIRMVFSSDTGKAVEIFTLYENNVVVTEHPTEGKRSCTVPAGTYAAVAAYLDTVRQEQSRYFSLSPEHNDADGYHEAAYTLYDKEGKVLMEKQTAHQLAVLEMVGEGLVRVTDSDSTCIYQPHSGKQSVVAYKATDLYGDRLAVVDEKGVCVYPVFSDKALCRIFVVATEANPHPVEGVRFSADGTELHLLLRNAAGTAYDRTVVVQEEIETGVVRVLGEWQDLLIPATEKEEQTLAYNVLKKLRYKEQELGYMLSAILQGHLRMDNTDYLLCELGHWLTDENGNVLRYEVLGHLMVSDGLYVAFEATVSDNELSWDTDKDWFLK